MIAGNGKLQQARLAGWGFVIGIERKLTKAEGVCIC